MSVKEEMKVEKTEKVKIGYLVIIVAVLVLIAFLSFSNKLLYCYGEDCEMYIKVEQTGACYKGCMFMTQPKHNLTTEESQGVRIEQYEKCSEMCMEYYTWK
jgi:hypothetical protein